MCCPACFALFLLLCAHVDNLHEIVNPAGQKGCLLFLLESPSPTKCLGTRRCSKVLQNIMQVRLKDLGLKANLVASLHCALGTRPEVSVVTWSGNRSRLCFRKSPSEGLWSAPKRMLSPWLLPSSRLPCHLSVDGCQGNRTGSWETKPELNKTLVKSGPFLTC